MLPFINFSDLARLYKLLKNIPKGLQAMVSELEDHITKTGRVEFTCDGCECNCSKVFLLES